ncbi:hypothetical protein GQ457_05G015590 [Hibiscus cannabinus]
MEIGDAYKLCDSELEILNHLFTDCHYSKTIWESILWICGISRVSQGWKEEILWLSRRLKGIYTIKVNTFDGVIRIMANVRHDLDLKRNLISWSTLNSKGYKYTAKGGVLKISKDSLVVMKWVEKTSKLYALLGSIIFGDTVVVSDSLSDEDFTNFDICN